MSVWKKLNKQDAFVTTYIAKKTWNLQGSKLDENGVKFLPAYSSFETPTEGLLKSRSSFVTGPPVDTNLYCDNLELAGEDTCYFVSDISVVGTVEGKREVKVSKVETYGEDIYKTNILRVTTNHTNGEVGKPKPSSITVQQILNGRARIIVDNTATSLTLTHDSGLCALNTYVYDLPRDCQFTLLVDQPTNSNCDFSLIVA